jgi:hypothetical protein
MTLKLLDFGGFFILIYWLDCQIKEIKIMKKLAMHWKILGMIVGLLMDY